MRPGRRRRARGGHNIIEYGLVFGLLLLCASISIQTIKDSFDFSPKKSALEKQMRRSVTKASE
jgi:hypothetical protein